MNQSGLPVLCAQLQMTQAGNQGEHSCCKSNAALESGWKVRHWLFWAFTTYFWIFNRLTRVFFEECEMRIQLKRISAIVFLHFWIKAALHPVCHPAFTVCAYHSLVSCAGWPHVSWPGVSLSRPPRCSHTRLHSAASAANPHDWRVWLHSDTIKDVILDVCCAFFSVYPQHFIRVLFPVRLRCHSWTLSTMDNVHDPSTSWTVHLIVANACIPIHASYFVSNSSVFDI